MGKRGRAEDKVKGEGDDLIGILKVVAISASSWFALLKTLPRFLSCPPEGGLGFSVFRSIRNSRYAGEERRREAAHHCALPQQTPPHTHTSPKKLLDDNDVIYFQYDSSTPLLETGLQKIKIKNKE
jgi:hypothetical protein